MLILRNEERAATVKALAAAMKCSRSTLYRKFGKEELSAMIRAFAHGDASSYHDYFQRNSTSSDADERGEDEAS
jgi:AraC-like DNA-binding protein